ncbi:hypothetical protein RND71_030082 [Anisodus tanguticus]|uniref:Uncharacterized protein n=1 Tax=Anisodus tanguticus TaxID=243964 RepID=A0AAE1V6Z4_9SOLA|nr:hypothetical protein RND71_030082 [Anisodus tanguticus]
MPISASIPLTADFSPWKNSGNLPVDSLKKKNRQKTITELEIREMMAYSVGANFTPHVITVNAGEILSTKEGQRDTQISLTDTREGEVVFLISRNTVALKPLGEGGGVVIFD